MPRRDNKQKPLEFKGTTLPVVAVTVRTLQAGELAEAATALFGDEAFFEGDAALLELSQLGELSECNWEQTKEILGAHGLKLIGVRGGSEELRRSAAAAGLPAFANFDRAARAAAENEAPAIAPPAENVAPPAAEVAVTPPLAPAPLPVSTMVVDRPLRSGQQVYARGGDLVVLAAVNAGAEVIADGSIHIYAPLRGRALAGACGATDARIFSTRFDAELVSIAGVYRTFENKVPGDLAGKPVQVRLVESPADAAAGEPAAATSRLLIEALKTN